MQGDRDGEKTATPPPFGDFRGRFQQRAAHPRILTSCANPVHDPPDISGGFPPGDSLHGAVDGKKPHLPCARLRQFVAIAPAIFLSKIKPLRDPP
jgi:hypothetical protein